MNKLSFNNRIIFWFLVASVLLLGNALLIYSNFQRLDHQRAWVDHTYQVIGELEGVVSSMKDVQSAQRGYIITGQLDYLNPYDVSRPKAIAYIKSLENLIKDNKRQIELLATLKEDVEARIQVASDIITTYQSNGQEAAFDMVKSGHGKRSMDEIRSIVAEMVNTEQDLLTERQRSVKEAEELTLLVGGLGLGTNVLILLFVFGLISRETHKRSKMEASLSLALSDMRKLSDDDKSLSEMSDYLQTSNTLAEAYSIIAKSMPQMLPETQGEVCMYNHSRNFVETIAVWGSMGRENGEFSPEQCWAIRRGNIHVSKPDGSSLVCSHLLNTDGVSICVPMQSQGEVLGLLSVSAPVPDNLAKYKQDLCERIGKQIALAMANLKLQDKLRNQSIRDPLTGLFNRRYLEETLEQEISRSSRNKYPFSVLVLDIDHFKKYNDTRGHDAGDALLVKFAQLVKNTTRKEDIACRYGGEEFVVVLPMTNIEMAQIVANKICEATRKMTIANGKDIFDGVTVSIGVSSYPSQAETREDLITKADAALYKAKEGGRDQVRVAE